MLSFSGLIEFNDKIKNFGIDLKERLAKFGESTRETVGKVLDRTKSRIEKIKVILRDYIDHAKVWNDDIRKEGLEFLRQYKEDLESLFEDIKTAFKDSILDSIKDHSAP